MNQQAKGTFWWMSQECNTFTVARQEFVVIQMKIEKKGTLRRRQRMRFQLSRCSFVGSPSHRLNCRSWPDCYSDVRSDKGSYILVKAARYKSIPVVVLEISGSLVQSWQCGFEVMGNQEVANKRGNNEVCIENRKKHWMVNTLSY